MNNIGNTPRKELHKEHYKAVFLKKQGLKLFNFYK